jgi:chloramphenicol 3-O-phosphotransferase
MSVTILSGPIGAGKTTVARELLTLLAAPVSYIEGDTFWSFVAKPHSRDRREVFHVIMRSMVAAAIPFARSGYEVLIDFSIPPQFLGTARKILKEVPLNYIALRPSLSVCETRAASRPEGRITDYANYRDFYAMFEDPSIQAVCDDESDASTVAKCLYEGLGKGEFIVA